MGWERAYRREAQVNVTHGLPAGGLGYKLTEPVWFPLSDLGTAQNRKSEFKRQEKAESWGESRTPSLLVCAGGVAAAGLKALGLMDPPGSSSASGIVLK